jgi:exodeoxyribonuclease V alpha subunit
MSSIQDPKLLEFIERARARATARALEKSKTLPITAPLAPFAPIQASSVEEITFPIPSLGGEISYNSKQQEFINLAASGASCILIGAAGTGKTTAQNGLVKSLMLSGRAGHLEHTSHKYLKDGTPGIVICAYTRRAVRNIRRRMPVELQENCVTIHKLLEYTRTFKEILDPVTMNLKTVPIFEATRNLLNPLPDSIHTIIFEESSMISTSLYKEVLDALSHQVQSIFLGDIEQLPPVFGSAILGYKFWELPVVELTEVYRQALDSPIIKLAHRILSGNPISPKEAATLSTPGLTIKQWTKTLYPETAMSQVASFMCKSYDDGSYNPEEAMILTPQNKGFGTIELNKYIANHIARRRGAITFEIIAGFMKLYFSVGDRVLYAKEDATILEIKANPTYYGTPAAKESPYLNYFGVRVGEPEVEKDTSKFELHMRDGTSKTQDAFSDDDWEKFSLGSIEERTNQASHQVKLLLEDSGDMIWIDKSAELNTLDLSYALTVHKAQGSEWDKVYFITHSSQQRMLYRELLYTAVTRAKNELFILCEPDTLERGIKIQRIKGKTWRDKAEAFKGKLE